MIQCATVGIPKEMKNAVSSISIAFCLDFLITNENILPRNAKQKLLEIILHVGWVTSLQSWVAKISCHCKTLLNECSISDYPSNFEGL